MTQKIADAGTIFDIETILQPVINAIGCSMDYLDGKIEFAGGSDFGLSFEGFADEIPLQMKEAFNFVNLADGYAAVLFPVAGDLYMTCIYSEFKASVWVMIIDAKKLSKRLNILQQTIPRFELEKMMENHTTYKGYVTKLGDSIIKTFRRGLDEATWSTSERA